MTGPKREYPQFKFDSFNLENGLERFQFSLTHILNLRNSWRIRLP